MADPHPEEPQSEGPEGMLRTFFGTASPDRVHHPVDYVWAVWRCSHLQDFWRRNARDAADARLVAIYLLRYHAGLSGPKIARFMDRDHSSIYHALSRAERMVDEDDYQFMRLLRDSLVLLRQSRFPT